MNIAFPEMMLGRGRAAFRAAWQCTLRVGLSTALFVVGAFAQPANPQGATAKVTAFVDVTVLPMDREASLPGQTVVVTGDRITAMGPSAAVTIPAGAERIEAKGKFLLPGLAEMHGHNPPPGSSREYIEAIYFLFVANGVTTVRSMLGWPGQLELRDAVNRGEMIGPSLTLAGPSFNGQSATSPAQAMEKVRQQKREGWDLLKVHPGLRRDVYDAMATTADEVGIRFAGHIPADVGLAHAIERGQQTVDHLDGYIEQLHAENAPVDPAQLAAIVQRTRETGTAVIPTMVLWETIIGAADLSQMLQYPELRYMPRAEVQRWRTASERRQGGANFNRARAQQIAANRKVLLKALDAAGATILFGTDSPQEFSVPGFSIHREMKAMSAAGMSNYAILRSATKNVGEHLKARDAFGTIAVGQRADLLLLNADPLADVGNVARRAGVMLRGRWLPEDQIQTRLEAIAAAQTR